MRHRLSNRKLNRTSSHRLALLRNLANALLKEEVIKTTLPTRDRDIVVKLFDVLGPRYANRNGGYLRILKCGFRQGDNAPMAYVELLDRPEEGEVIAAAE